MAIFELLTLRLRLREFQTCDALGFYQMNADPEVLRYTGDHPFKDIKAAENFISTYDHYAKYGYGRWTVERLEDNAYLGFCGLKYHPKTSEVDLGYRLDRNFWGKGYATEAALACLDYAFRSLKLNQVIGRAAQQNTGSLRVLEKIGMRKLKPISFDKQDGFLYVIGKDNFLS